MQSDFATLNKASIWCEASRIVHEEGFRAFWKGNMVTIVHRLPYSAVNFYAYERYKSVSDTILWIMIILAVLMYHPLSLVVAYLNAALPFYVLQFFQSICGIESHKGNVSADMSVHFVSGGLAGITAASATYPLDLVRTRLAAQVMPNFMLRLESDVHLVIFYLMFFFAHYSVLKRIFGVVSLQSFVIIFYYWFFFSCFRCSIVGLNHLITILES